jgi:hypothetical protein
VTRLRLTSVVLAVLALSGPLASPARAVESTRLVVSIVCIADGEGERQVLSAAPRPNVACDQVAAAPLVERQTFSSRDLPHALYQRPPPNA